MYSAVKAHIIMTGHTIFCDIQRKRIPLRQKFDSIIKCFWCYRPVARRLWKSRFPVHKLRFAVCALTHVIAIIYVLSHKIQWLMDQLHICLCDLRQILFEFFQSLFRIMT